ncbi:hypothetical protein ACN9MY_15460 [Pseudoduganella sp. R-31]|uniref:hypothetical protein n=1 Tax=unclassified Pseudoduganella TaxID=2637179 RepID=UPI003CF47C48
MSLISTRAACALPDKHCLLLAAAALLSTTAWAGRPLATDDATILEPGDCQVEAWHQQSGGLHEWWAMPACRVGGWELAAGKGQSRNAALQAKTVLRGLQTNGWGLGLAIATQHGMTRQHTVNVPLTISFAGDALLLHLNAGWMRPYAAPGRATWSVGGEYALAPRWSASLESYGSHHRPPTRQAGLRYALVEGRLDLDASVAKTPGAPHQLALGVTWALPGLLY